MLYQLLVIDNKDISDILSGFKQFMLLTGQRRAMYITFYEKDYN